MFNLNITVMEQKKRFRPTLTAYRALENEVSQLNKDKKVLEKSNKFCEDELIRLREVIKEQDDEILALTHEVEHLRNRSFFARLLNK